MDSISEMRCHISVNWQRNCVFNRQWNYQSPTSLEFCDGNLPTKASNHYNDIIMGALASQITSLTIVYSSVYSGADQRKHQSSASLAFVRGILGRLVNSPHKGPVTRKMFPFGDVIMCGRHEVIVIVPLSFSYCKQYRVIFSRIISSVDSTSTYHTVIRLWHRKWKFHIDGVAWKVFLS